MRKNILILVVFGLIALVSAAEIQMENKGEETGRIINMDIIERIRTFLGLTDTPASYAGESGQCVKVNAGENALEFGECGNVSGNASYNYSTATYDMYGQWWYNYTDTVKDVWVNESGDVMTGDLKIEKFAPSLWLMALNDSIGPPYISLANSSGWGFTIYKDTRLEPSNNKLIFEDLNDASKSFVYDAEFGRMGINDQSPSYTLDVAGSISSSTDSFCNKTNCYTLADFLSNATGGVPYNYSTATYSMYGHWWYNMSDGGMDYTNLALTNESETWDAGLNISMGADGWFKGMLNWSWLQNIPDYVKDWSLHLTHLSNFTDDILWTSGFNSTGDTRWQMDYTNIGIINQTNTWEEPQNFSKGIITDNITARTDSQTFLRLESNSITGIVNSLIIFNISYTGATPYFVFPSSDTRFSMGNTEPDNLFEITSNEADFFFLQSTTRPIFKVRGDTGRVGILTESPTVELEVNGSVLIKTNLTLEGYPKGEGFNLTMQQVGFNSVTNFYTSDTLNVYNITLNSTVGVKYVKYEFCGYIYDFSGDSNWLIDVLDCDGNKLASGPCATQSLNTESTTYDSCCVSGIDTSLRDNCNYYVNLDEKLGSAYLFHESTELIKYMDGDA